MVTMINKKLVMEQLSRVMDPELHINIVDLGLIYAVKVKGKQVLVEMTLTTPGCPLAPIIDRMVKEALEPLGAEVKLELVWDPPWTKDLMSEDAKIKLGML